jgi:hypothetical protein
VLVGYGKKKKTENRKQKEEERSAAPLSRSGVSLAKLREEEGTSRASSYLKAELGGGERVSFISWQNQHQVQGKYSEHGERVSPPPPCSGSRRRGRRSLQSSCCCRCRLRGLGARGLPVGFGLCQGRLEDADCLFIGWLVALTEERVRKSEKKRRYYLFVRRKGLQAESRRRR